MKTVRLACQAMATRFEIVLHGRDQVRLRAAGEEAISEIKRLHGRLNAFDPKSWIGRLNARQDAGRLRISSELFRLLTHLQRLSEITDGTFDITVGPLLEIWGFRDSPAGRPTSSQIEETLERVGMRRLNLSSRERTIDFESSGMKLDLGAVGKGYALDVAADVLLSAGIESALMHGGTSTVRVIGNDPADRPWKVAISSPGELDSTKPPIGTVQLADEALSVSSIFGRRVDIGDTSVGHVLDPRSGTPVESADMAVVAAPTATDADALSTALLILGKAGIRSIAEQVVGFRGAVVRDGIVIQERETIRIHET